MPCGRNFRITHSADKRENSRRVIDTLSSKVVGVARWEPVSWPPSRILNTTAVFSSFVVFSPRLPIRNTSLLQIQELKTILLYYLSSAGQKSGTVWLDSVLRVSQSKSWSIGWPGLYLEALKENPRPYKLLAKFSSTQLWGWSHFLAGYQPEIVLSF